MSELASVLDWFFCFYRVYKLVPASEETRGWGEGERFQIPALCFHGEDMSGDGWGVQVTIIRRRVFLIKM